MQTIKYTISINQHLNYQVDKFKAQNIGETIGLADHYIFSNAGNLCPSTFEPNDKSDFVFFLRWDKEEMLYEIYPLLIWNVIATFQWTFKRS